MSSEQSITYPIGVAELARKCGKQPRTARRVAATHGIGIMVAGRRVIRSEAEKKALLKKIRPTSGCPKFVPGNSFGQPPKKLPRK